MKTKKKRRQRRQKSASQIGLQKNIITLNTSSFEPDLNADWIKHANPEATARDRAAGEKATKYLKDMKDEDDEIAKPVRVQLQDCEWKFDNLPEDEIELEACCRWEYVRESKFIRDVTKLNGELGKGKMPTSAEQELLARLHSICESPFSSTNHFFKSPPFPQPWQSLDNAHKPLTMSKIPPAEYAFQAIDWSGRSPKKLRSRLGLVQPGRLPQMFPKRWT